MILVRYLSTALAESLISLSGMSTGPLALFTMSDITILFIFFLEAGRYLKLKDSGKTFFLWLQHLDDFCKIQ